MAVVVVALVHGASRLGPPPRGEDLPPSPTPVQPDAPAVAPTTERASPPVAELPSEPLERSFELERRGDLEGAAAAAAEAVIASDTRDPRLQAGKLAILRNRLDEAEVWLRPLAMADPSDVAVRYDLALVAHRRGLSAEARAGYEAVLELQPSHADARYNLALLLRDAADLQGARRQLQLLREHHPADGRVEALMRSLDDAGP